MSVIALLALACFPVFAQAECVSSSCVQYTEAIPNSEGENPSTPHKHPPVAKAADNGGASTPTGKASKPASGGETDESSENGSSKEGGAPATGNGGGTGQGKPGGSANNGSTPQAQHGGQNAGTSATHSSSGSSSPLIPILVAIAVLAAISVGAVMYRQRRQRRGPTASAPSPKAS
jgi:cobalamin biosynthesis Mg chelatase CobN